MTEPTSNFKSSKPWFYVFLYGICMGIADIIPGISGGTIAFIMGFYKDLIESLKSINFNSLKYALKGDFRLISWEFLLALGSGIVFAFLTLIHLFNYILSHLPYREYLYASFCGLIAASAFIFAKKISRWSFSLILFFMLGLGISFALTNFEAFLEKDETYDIPFEYNSPITLANYDPDNKLLKNISESSLSVLLSQGKIRENELVFYVQGNRWVKVNEIVFREKFWFNPVLAVCGAIAISAMLLPGISGSYLLTVFGVYGTIISALSDFIKAIFHFSWDQTSFLILFNLGLGILLGAILFARVVSWLFKKFESIAMSLLLGFMLGAMRTIWPFWTYSYKINPLKLDKGVILKPEFPQYVDLAWERLSLGILCFVLSFVFILILEKNRDFLLIGKYENVVNNEPDAKINHEQAL